MNIKQYLLIKIIYTIVETRTTNSINICLSLVMIACLIS